MTDRILCHIHSKDLSNNNQYGFTPQRGTVDAAMEVEKFIEKSLRFKQCTVTVSLDVKGAFDAAWWPSILKQLRELKCPKNLHNRNAAELAIVHEVENGTMYINEVYTDGSKVPATCC